MNHERKRLFNISLAVAVAIAVLPNISKETPAALSSVFLNTPTDCTDLKPGEFRVAVIPGSWYFIGGDGKRFPDQAQKERLQATAKYWNQNRDTIKAIYLLDGVANDGSDFNKNYLLQIEPAIPSSIIFVEYKSKDTHSNMIEATKLIPPGSKAVIISHPSHLPRAVWDACVKGIKAIGVAAETVQDSATINMEKAKLFVTALLDREGWVSAWWKNNVK